MLKMRTYFSRYDFNKDGVIRRVDVESMAMNFADREGFSQAETKAVIKCFDGVSISFTLCRRPTRSIDLTCITEIA